MIELSVVRDLVAIFGVIAGLSYYVLTVRNARRVRKEAWAREFSEFNLEEHSIFMELLLMEWDNFDDYVSKYDSTVNLDNYSKRQLIWNRLNRMGYELFQGNVDIETIYNYTGYQNFWFLWNKFKPIIMEDRKRYSNPHLYRWFEYLMDELAKERIRQGLPADAIDFDGYTTN